MKVEPGDVVRFKYAQGKPLVAVVLRVSKRGDKFVGRVDDEHNPGQRWEFTTGYIKVSSIIERGQPFRPPSAARQIAEEAGF